METLKFTNYQWLEGTSDKELLKKQAESKFWDKGKWENYILPHLPSDVSGMTYIDMGCNAGLFLQYAEKMGFERSIGADINPEVIEIGKEHRDKHGFKYELIAGKMQDVIDKVPVCDYMSFVNSHYYLLVQEWLDLVAVLRKKARYVIITGIKKKEYFCMASGRRPNIMSYFKDWELVKHIPQIEREGDPCPRSLETFCFKNPDMDRVDISTLLKGNHVQGRYYEELEMGISPLKTRYFKMLCKRKRSKPREDMISWMYKKVDMYNSVKENGYREPIIINGHNKILDGNHRKEILEYLGFKTAIIRKV